MEEDERNKKLKAGKEKLAQFQKKRKKKKHGSESKPGEKVGGHDVRISGTRDRASPQELFSGADMFSYDSDSLSMSSQSEGESSDISAQESRSLMVVKSQLQEKLQRIAELEESLMGKQLALDSVLRENEDLQYQLSQKSENNKTEPVSEVKLDEGDQLSVPLSEIMDHSTEAVNHVDQSRSHDNAGENNMADIRDLTQQVQWLQLQLKQTGATLQMQTERQSDTVKALKQARDEILLLQDSVTQKDQLVEQLADKLVHISKEYGELKDMCAISQNSPGSVEVDKAGNYEDDVGKKLLELRESLQKEHEEQLEKIYVEKDAELKFARQECQMMKEMYQRTSADINDLTDEVQTLKIETERVKFENKSLTDHLINSREEFVKLKEECEETKIKMDAVSKELKVAKEAEGKSREENALLRGEVSLIKEEKDRINAELQSLKMDKEKVEFELEKLKVEHCGSDRLKQELENQIIAVQDQYQSMKESLDVLASEKTAMTSELIALHEENQKAAEQIAAYEAQITDYESTMSQNSDLMEENFTLRTQNDELYNKINNQKDVIASLRSDLDVLSCDNAQLADTMKEISSVMERYKQETETWEAEKMSMNSEIENLRTSLETLQGEQKLREEKFSSEIENLGQEILKSEMECESYRNKIEQLNSQVSFSPANNVPGQSEEVMQKIKNVEECVVEPELISPEIQQHCFTASNLSHLESEPNVPATSTSVVQQSVSEEHNETVQSFVSERVPYDSPVEFNIQDSVCKGKIAESTESQNTREERYKDKLIAQLQKEIRKLKNKLAMIPSEMAPDVSSVLEMNVDTENDTAYQTLEQTETKDESVCEKLHLEQEIQVLKEKLDVLKQEYSGVVSGAEILLAEKDSLQKQRDDTQHRLDIVQSEISQMSTEVEKLKYENERLRKTEPHTAEVSDLDLPRIVASGAEEFLHASSSSDCSRGDVNVDPSNVSVFSLAGNKFQQAVSLEPDCIDSDVAAVKGNQENSVPETHDLERSSSRSSLMEVNLESETSGSETMLVEAGILKGTVVQLSEENKLRTLVEEKEQLLKDLGVQVETVTELLKEKNELCKENKSLKQEMENEIEKNKVLRDKSSAESEKLEHEIQALEEQIKLISNENREMKDSYEEKIVSKAAEVESLNVQNLELQSVISDFRTENEKLLVEKETVLSDNKALKCSFEEIQKEFSEMQHCLSQLNSENQELIEDKKSLFQIKAEMEENALKIRQEHEQEIKNLNDNLGALRNQNETLLKTQKKLTENGEKLHTEKLEMLEKFRELEDKVSKNQKLSDQLNKLENEKTCLTRENDLLNGEVEGLKRDLQEVIQQLEAVDGKFVEKSEETVKLQGEVDVLQTQIQGFQTKIAGLEEELLELCNQLQSYDDTIVQKEDLATRLEQEILEVLSENTGLKEKVLSLQCEIESLGKKHQVVVEQLEVYSQRSGKNSENETDRSLMEQLELELKIKQKLQKDLEKAQSDSVEARKDISELTSQLELVCAELKTMEAEILEKDELVAKCVKEKEVALSERNNLSSELERVELDFNTIVQQRDRLSNEAETLQQHLNAVSENRNHVRTQIEILASELESVSVSRDEIAGRYYAAEKENVSLKQASEQNKHFLSLVQEKVVKFEQVLDEKLSLEDQNVSLSERIEELDARVVAINQEKQEVEKVVERLTGMLRDMQTKYEEVRSEMELTKKKCDKEICQLQTNLAEMNNNVQELRSMLDFMENEMYNAGEEKSCLKENLEQQQTQYLEAVEQKQRLEELLSEKHQKDLQNQKTVSQQMRSEHSLSRVESSFGSSDAGSLTRIDAETQTEYQPHLYVRQRDPETGNMRSVFRCLCNTEVQTDVSLFYMEADAIMPVSDIAKNVNLNIEEIDQSLLNGSVNTSTDLESSEKGNSEEVKSVYDTDPDRDVEDTISDITIVHTNSMNSSTSEGVSGSEECDTSVNYDSQATKLVEHTPVSVSSVDSGIHTLEDGAQYERRLEELRTRLDQSRVDFDTLRELYEAQVADLKKASRYNAENFTHSETQTDVSECSGLQEELLIQHEEKLKALEMEFEQKEKDLQETIEQRLLKKFEFREKKLKMQEDNFDKKLKQSEYAIEEKYIEQMRKREAEIMFEAEQDMKKHAQTVEHAVNQKMEAFRKTKDAEFVRTMQKVRADLTERHQHEIERLHAEYHSGGEGLASDDAREPELLHMVQRLNREKQELLEARDALCGQIEEVHQHQEQLRHSFEGIMGDPDGSLTTAGDETNAFSQSVQQQQGWLDWKLAPDFSFGSQFGAESLSESFDRGQHCSKTDCQATKLKYDELIGKIQRFRSLSDAVQEVSSLHHLADGTVSQEDDSDTNVGMNKFVEDPDGDLCVLQRITTIHLEHSVRDKGEPLDRDKMDQFIAETQKEEDSNTQGHFEAVESAHDHTENAQGHFSENEDEESDSSSEVHGNRQDEDVVSSATTGSGEGRFSGNESENESRQDQISVREVLSGSSDSEEENDSVFLSIKKADFGFRLPSDRGVLSSLSDLKDGHFSESSEESGGPRFSQRRCFSDSGAASDQPEVNIEGQFVKFDTVTTGTSISKTPQGSSSENKDGHFVHISKDIGNLEATSTRKNSEGQFVRELTQKDHTSEAVSEGQEAAEGRDVTSRMDCHEGTSTPTNVQIFSQDTRECAGVPNSISLDSCPSSGQFVIEVSPREEQPPGSAEFQAMNLQAVRMHPERTTGEQTGDYFEEKILVARVERPVSRDSMSPRSLVPSQSPDDSSNSNLDGLQDQILRDYSTPVTRSLKRQDGVQGSQGDDFTEERIDSGDILESLQCEIQRDNPQDSPRVDTRVDDCFLEEQERIDSGDLQASTRQFHEAPEGTQAIHPSFENAVFDLINQGSPYMLETGITCLTDSSVSETLSTAYQDNSEADAVMENMQNTRVDFSESPLESDIVELMRRCEELQKEVKGLTEEKHALQGQVLEHLGIHEVSKKLKEENSSLSRINKELQKKCEAVEEMEECVLSLDEQVEKLKIDKAVLEETLQSQAELNDRNKADKERLNFETQTLRKEVERLKDSLDEVTTLAASCDLSEVKVELEALRLEKDSLQKTIEEVDAEKQHCEIYAINLKDQLEAAEMDNDRLHSSMVEESYRCENEIGDLNFKIKNLEKEKDSVQESYKTELELMLKDKDQMQKTIDTLEQTVQSQEQEVQERKDLEESLKAELDLVQREKSDIMERKDLLEETLQKKNSEAESERENGSFLSLNSRILQLEREKESLMKRLKDNGDGQTEEDMPDSSVDLKTEIKVLEAEKKMIQDKLHSQIKDHKKEKHELLKMYSDLKSQVEPLMISKQELEDEVKELKILVENQSEDQKQNSHVKAKEQQEVIDNQEGGARSGQSIMQFPPVLTMEDLEELEELKNSIRDLKRDMKEKDVYVRKLEEHLLNLGGLPDLSKSTPKSPMLKPAGRLPAFGQSTPSDGKKTRTSGRFESSGNNSLDRGNDVVDLRESSGEVERLDLSSIHPDVADSSTLSEGFMDVLYGSEPRLFTSSVQLDAQSVTSAVDSLDGSERIQSRLTAQEDGHLALELKQFELVDEISKLRRDFNETKAIYARETSLLSEALEREKLQSQSVMKQTSKETDSSSSSHHQSVLDPGTSVSLETSRLRQELAVLREENKMLRIENDRWMNRLKEQELIVLELKERLSRNTAGIEEIEEVFGRQLALLQKQREELVDQLRDREHQNTRLSSSLGEKSVIEESLRREKDILIVKLQEKSDVEKELHEKKLKLKEMIHNQKLLEERIYQKDMSERELMKQKRLLEQDLFEIEAKLREREEFLGFEKNQLLKELRDKHVTVRRRSLLVDSDDDVKSVCSDSSGISDRHIGRLEIMLEEVEKQHAAAVSVLRDQLKAKYERRELAMKDSHAGSLSALRIGQQNQVQET